MARQRTRRLRAAPEPCVFCGRLTGHASGCVAADPQPDPQVRAVAYSSVVAPWFWQGSNAHTATFMSGMTHSAQVPSTHMGTMTMQVPIQGAEWRNPEVTTPRVIEEPIGNASTWDFDAARSLWRRRRDGHCVTTLALHDTGCRNIIEFEQRYLRDAPRALVINSPDGTMSVNEFQRVQEEVRRVPPGTRIEVRLGRNDLLLGRTDAACETCEHDPCDCYWTTRDGTRVRVVAMDDGHIWNALRAAQRRGGRYLEDNPRYHPLIREARRRGWYGGVPPLRVEQADARQDLLPEEEPREAVPAREPYKLGKRLIKID